MPLQPLQFNYGGGARGFKSAAGRVMIPIHELLSRIRWDPAFGRGAFEIGYLDHVRAGIVRVPLARVSFPAGDHFAVTVVDDDGFAHVVPYHRIREVRRDGAVIWQRPAPRGADR